MIAFVRGTVAEIDATTAVVEVGGIGLAVRCTPDTLAELRTGTEATLPTTLVVREDSWTLFGFSDEDERRMFDLVQTVSGVGPKIAQAMLAVLRPDAIRAAIAHEDIKALTTVPGIGKKGAQRIVLELRDRIGEIIPATSAGAASVSAHGPEEWRLQVHTGLVGLGWSAKDADAAVDAVAPAAAEMATPDVAHLLRAALRALSRP